MFAAASGCAAGSFALLAPFALALLLAPVPALFGFDPPLLAVFASDGVLLIVELEVLPALPAELWSDWIFAEDLFAAAGAGAGPEAGCGEAASGVAEGAAGAVIGAVALSKAANGCVSLCCVVTGADACCRCGDA